MSNLLLSYLNQRMAETGTAKKNVSHAPGPVITISREVGCNGVKLANKMAVRFNSKFPGANWRVDRKSVV